MPPEPLPWDRKELRRHHGGGGVGGFGVGGGGGGPRWREAPFPHHHPPYNHNHNNHHHHHHGGHHGGGVPRWAPEFPYRPPPGHGKQGGRHLYLDDFGHGFMPSRANDKMIDDETCRSSGSGRYGRNSKENRGSFGQKDWKGHSSEIASQPTGPGRPNNSSEQRSVDNVQSYNISNPNSESVNSRDQSQPKDQHDINGGVGAIGSTNQKFDRESSLGSLDWKPLKWTRSGCLSSRGPGFNHSNSFKSVAADTEEEKVELPTKDDTSVPSLPGDTAAACVKSVAPEETSSRKKPRLGWGEGLAKYEKKKVEGADDSAIKDETIAGASNSEAEHSHPSNLDVKGPRVAVFADCTSPATPSSVACSSSSGLEEKQLLKVVTVDHDSTNLCSSPSFLSQNHSNELTFNLENLGLTSISQLNSSINELLQSNDPSSAESGLWGSTAMNKLLGWKNDISKTLEATESEIDMLENELKSLIPESERSFPHLAASSSVRGESDLNRCDDHIAASHITIRPTELQLVPSGCKIVENAVNTVEDECAALKDEDVDSPGSATSMFAEMPSSGDDVCLPDVLKDVEGLMSVNISGDLEVEWQMHGLNKEKVVGLSTHELKPQVIASNSAIPGDDKLQSGREGLCELILGNRDCSHVSSELYKLLPTREYHFDVSGVANASCLHNDSVKERFFRRKRFLRFKERVITLKFKLYQHMWKEDIHLLSLKKLRSKSQKKLDLSVRALNNGYQKHRSSVRSRYSSTATVSVVSMKEMLNYASKLLSDSQVNPQRNMLKMPALILDKHERTRFICSNGLVEDPCAVEKERSLINPWTSEEKEIFIDKLALFGKDFRKIASFLDYKTTADCIEFYYKNHKSDSFDKIKKNPEFSKQAKSLSANTYLVASGKRWNREANAVSLDDSVEIQQRCSSKSFSGTSSSYRIARVEDSLLERSNSLDVFDSERETVAADVLAGICGSLSSEAMSSCITSSFDPGEGYQERKLQRVGSSTMRPLTPEVTQDVDDETCSDESCAKIDPTDWTDEEKSIFIQSVSSYGKDFSMISRCVGTRSPEQCKVFFSKARKCLGLDMICPGPGNLSRDYSNGGGSDMEDACVVQTGSVICCEKFGFKMEEVIPSPDIKLKHDHDEVGMTNVEPDLNRVEEDSEVGDMDSTVTGLLSKNLVSDEFQMADKPELGYDGDIVNRNGAGAELTSVQDNENMLIGPNLEAADGVRAANSRGLCSRPGSESANGVLCAAYVGNPKEKLEQRLVLSQSNRHTRETENAESGHSHVNELKCFLEEKQSENDLTGSDSHSAAGTSSSGFGVASGLQKKTDLKLNPTQKPHVFALPETDCSAPLDLGPKVSTTRRHGTSPNDDQAALDLANISDEDKGKASRANKQRLSGHSSLEHLGSSYIIRGYPVPVSVVKEMTDDLSCKRPIPFQSICQSNGIHFGWGSSQDSYLQRCSSSSKPADSDSELALAPLEQSKDCSRPTSGCPFDVDKPCCSRDVKLFGQILSKPSSQQKPNPSTQQNESNSTLQHKVGSRSYNVKCSSSHSIDVHSASAKYDHGNFVGLENLPVKSFDFWDQNGLQNGFSPLPDSAMLLAKYPAAFGNYSMTSSKVEQTPLHGVGKKGDCNLNNVSVFSTRDISGSKGVADIHMYRNQEVQPFTIEMRQRHDMIFSEMQRRNGFEVVSGMQQQSRGMVGINVVGKGGVLMGGQCTGVSDPVAALRMHYAKTEQFSGQTGGFVREDDSWRGKGSIGR